MQPNVLPTGPHPQPGPNGRPHQVMNYQELTARIALVRNQLEQGEQATASLNLALNGPPLGGPTDVAVLQQKLKDTQNLQAQRKEYLSKLMYMSMSYQ